MERLNNQYEQFKFLPVTSVDEMKVIGFEIIEDNNSSIFSCNPLDNQEFKRLDTLYSEMFKWLLEEVKTLDYIPVLFIPVDPNLLVTDFGETLLEKISMCNLEGIPFENIVVQFAEQDYKGEFESLYYLTKYYRTFHVKLAINQITSGVTNLARVGMLKPNIMNVDLSTYKIQTASTEEQDILLSLSALSRKIGATLLYSHIRSDIHLYLTWKNNGRYLSGEFIHKSVERMNEAYGCSILLRKEIGDFVGREKKKLSVLFEIGKEINEQIKHCIDSSNTMSNHDQLIECIISDIGEFSYRIYIVDSDGYQISPNYLKQAEVWQVFREFEGRNWSWRPYFLKNIVQMKYEKRGMLSDIYSDLETERLIRTFSYPLTKDLFIFIDLDPTYLYEKDALL